MKCQRPQPDGLGTAQQAGSAPPTNTRNEAAGDIQAEVEAAGKEGGHVAGSMKQGRACALSVGDDGLLRTNQGCVDGEEDGERASSTAWGIVLGVSSVRPCTNRFS